MTTKRMTHLVMEPHNLNPLKAMVRVRGSVGCVRTEDAPEYVDNGVFDFPLSLCVY